VTENNFIHITLWMYFSFICLATPAKLGLQNNLKHTFVTLLHYFYLVFEANR
jgi:hypothetical protein